jgi:hypothetical protein
MDRPNFQWRLHALVTIDSDIPAAYPGGPSHKKGDKAAMTSEAILSNGTSLSFMTPSAVALALGTSIKAAKRAVNMKPTASSPIPSPEGRVHMIRDHAALFDFFEECFVTATFSFQALEAYANYKIAYNLRGSYAFKRKSKREVLTRPELEKRLSTEDKLGLVLPDILGIQSPKGHQEWQEFLTLKWVRDSTIHLKSHHQWQAGENIEDSPYAFFIRESPLELPKASIRLIRWFANGPENPWLDGAQQLLDENS